MNIVDTISLFRKYQIYILLRCNRFFVIFTLFYITSQTPFFLISHCLFLMLSVYVL